VIRPAREEDRAGVVETIRTVADDGTYVVAENVATELERERHSSGPTRNDHGSCSSRSAGRSRTGTTRRDGRH